MCVASYAETSFGNRAGNASERVSECGAAGELSLLAHVRSDGRADLRQEVVKSTDAAMAMELLRDVSPPSHVRSRARIESQPHDESNTHRFTAQQNVDERHAHQHVEPQHSPEQQLWVHIRRPQSRALTPTLLLSSLYLATKQPSKYDRIEAKEAEQQTRVVAQSTSSQRPLSLRNPPWRFRVRRSNLNRGLKTISSLAIALRCYEVRVLALLFFSAAASLPRRVCVCVCVAVFCSRGVAALRGECS